MLPWWFLGAIAKRGAGRGGGDQRLPQAIGRGSHLGQLASAGLGRQWAKATGLPLGVMVAAAKDDTATPVPINGQIIAAEQGLVNAVSAAGLIPRKYNFANHSYSGFNGVSGSGA